MSKKKVSGSTMTLKDFHGGSIPSDLPLPSAPGVTVRPSDRVGYDRPASWGTPMGRPDHWSRPHTSPATRHYDDKSLFLPHTAPIGRNFDEDERKPLDGSSAPRRTISDESIHAPLPSRVEVKRSSSLSRQVAPVSPVGNANSYSARLTETVTVHGGTNSQSFGASKEHGSSTGGGHPNVWSMRKEVAGAVESEQSAWSSANAVSKLAHASALDKVSSGRWQSVHYQTDVEVVRPSEVESRPHAFINSNRIDIVGEKGNSDEMLARHAERGLVIGSQMQGGRNELSEHERSGVSKYSDVRPRSAVQFSDGVQPARTDSKVVGSESPHHIASEPVERPKLKLLPRTKPLESSEPSVTEYTQGYRQVNDSSHVEPVYQGHGHANYAKPVSAGTESAKELGQRPKLNLKPLKPRPEVHEQSEGNKERDRNALFGGARPRELVLKERGVDDVAIKSYDAVESSNRVEQNIPRSEKLHDHSVQTRYGEKTEDGLNQRTGRKPERKEQKVDGDRVLGQRKNWRSGDNSNNNRRNLRETERQQVPERPPSPETWRKPVESSQGAGGPRYGRGASAVELAQAFSKSVSDPKVNDRFSGQRGLNSGRNQMPFSRLVGPTSRPQINGY
uniref:Translation initiation factor-related n=1 Tax=Trifolium repens TaxID=3899 RepID=D3YBD7_TRIRP|nr:translation initiation factor-related [Trifolium repens]